MRIHWVLTIVLVALVVSSLPVSVGGVPSTPSGRSTSALLVATISAGPQGQAQPISPYFWGLNVESTHPFTLSDGALVAATPVTYLRYPGGTDGDRMNYTSGVVYGFTGTSNAAVTPVSQFVATCLAISCHAIMELPAEINDSATAAYYAAYVLNTMHFHPAFWEIGNEPAGWVHYNVPWSKWGSGGGGNATPMQYAYIVHTYIRAIRAVDPTTPIIALAAGQSAQYARPWVQSVARVDGSQLAGIAVHSYSAWSGPPSNPTLAGFFSNLQAKWQLPNVLANGRQNIQTACSSCSSTKLFVDEINAAYGTGTYLNFAGSFNGTLYIASEITQALVNHADSLEWFDYAGNFPGAWKEFGSGPDTQYYLFADLMSLLKNETLPTTVTGPGGVYAAATTNGVTNAVLAVNVNVTNSVGIDLSSAGFATSSSLNEYLWPTGSPHPTESQIPFSSQPTLPPLSVAVFTGPSPLISPNLFPVEVVERGLPVGTSWSATVNGTLETGQGNVLTFEEANGTYPFSIASPPGFSANPSTGSLVVSGTSVTESITFTPTSGPTFAVTIAASGLPPGVRWYLNITGQGSVVSEGSTASVNLPNGTFTFHLASADKRYQPDSPVGTLSVAGSPLAQSIRFSPVMFAVAFSESGLSSDRSWTVTFGGNVKSSTNSSIVFRSTNGSFYYSVGPVSGYAMTPISGTLVVNGSGVNRPVTYTLPSVTSVTAGLFGLPRSEGYAVLVATLALASLALAAMLVLIFRRRRRSSTLPRSDRYLRWRESEARVSDDVATDLSPDGAEDDYFT